MKKLILMLWILVLMANSCDKNCQDCGRVGYTRYYMINSTNEPITITWFGHSTLPSNVASEFVIASDERVLLYESSIGLSITPSLDQAIGTSPFGSTAPYDSLRITSSSKTVLFINNICELKGNPLCEENHELIRSIDTKDKKVEEWEFKIQ